MNTTFLAFSIFELFREEELHTDLSFEDRCALARQIAELEARGFVVDLVTGQIFEDVDIDAPVALVPPTPVSARGWN
jgi:hypothetical protein